MNNYLYPTFDFENLTQPQINGWVVKEIIETEKDPLFKAVKKLFKDDYGNDYILTPGELAIFKLIALREHKFSQLVCCTQYGKTLTVGQGVLMRISNHPEDWLVIVPNLKRGRIMLNYIIKATATEDYFRGKLTGADFEKKDALNRLLEEKSKVKLTYRMTDKKSSYGSIEIITAEARRKRDAINAIMGFGGRNVIEEEAALLDDEIDAGVFRMLAGKGEDTFLLKIGNPFRRNHFLESWEDPDYKKIYIDYRIALADGRYVESFIKKAMKKPLASVLYKCRFPKEEDIDEESYMPLLTTSEVRKAMMKGEMQHFGHKRLGVDVASGGRNYSVVVLRSKTYAEKKLKNKDPDTMSLVGNVLQKRLDAGRDEQDKLGQVFVDAIGVGVGVFHRTREHLSDTVGVVGGERAESPEEFRNKRAENYWRLREWILTGGKLSDDEDWLELAEIRYKINSDKQIKIMSKEEMMAKGIESPDVADSLMMTFNKKDKKKRGKRRRPGVNPFDQHNLRKQQIIERNRGIIRNYDENN